MIKSSLRNLAEIAIFTVRYNINIMGVDKGKEMIGIHRNRPLSTLEELRGLVAGIDASILLMNIVKGNRHLQQKFWMVPAVDFDLELHSALNETLLVLRRYDIILNINYLMI